MQAKYPDLSDKVIQLGLDCTRNNEVGLRRCYDGVAPFDASFSKRAGISFQTPTNGERGGTDKHG